MGVLFLAVAVIIINIGFWAVFLAKFKKLFSTDDIISSVRTEMNHMIADVQRSTSLNVDLIDNRIKELKAITAEADRHLAVLRNDMEKMDQSAVYQSRINSFTSPKKEVVTERRGAAKQPRQSTPSSAQKSSSSSSLGDFLQRSAQSYMKAAKPAGGLYGDEAVSLTERGEQALSRQGDLFEDSVTVDVPKPQTFTVKSDGSSYAAVPLVGPEVTFVENPVVPKKDFNAQVRDLASLGQSVEEIASTLGRSIQEVQFALDLGF